jgi:hypothetical protein
LKDKEIRITCRCADVLPLDSITPFQGDFKSRDIYDIENIIISILKYGISFPFFIWRHENLNYCIDGHGRKSALSLLRERGYTVPEIPVVYLTANDEAEARHKFMRLNSRYGSMTEESVLDFIGDMSIDFSELSIPDISNIDFSAKETVCDILEHTKESKIKDKKLKRCPYCGGILT